MYAIFQSFLVYCVIDDNGIFYQSNSYVILHNFSWGHSGLWGGRAVYKSIMGGPLSILKCNKQPTYDDVGKVNEKMIAFFKNNPWIVTNYRGIVL